MKVLIVQNSLLPVHLYGGTERVIWSLGKELVRRGHEVTFLAKQGSTSDFASIIPIDDSRTILEQVPKDFDIVHFQFTPANFESIEYPYVVTIHGNSTNPEEKYSQNSIFVSQNHAMRFGSNSFVYNGLDWSDYDKPDLGTKRDYFHFLGKAAWRVKNVQGAIDTIKKTRSEKLVVLGGNRLNINMGFRFTLSPRIRFEGMVGGSQKNKLINGSKGLLFPVRWNEPFGLAIIESLFYGCPVFGTPYGSLPELVKPEVGFLSAHSEELSQALLKSNKFSAEVCHDYAVSEFDSKKMTTSYLEKYDQVLTGNTLNRSSPSLQNVQTERFLPWD